MTHTLTHRILARRHASRDAWHASGHTALAGGGAAQVRVLACAAASHVRGQVAERGSVGAQHAALCCRESASERSSITPAATHQDQSDAFAHSE
jgi:hypothetical protein